METDAEENVAERNRSRLTSPRSPTSPRRQRKENHFATVGKSLEWRRWWREADAAARFDDFRLLRRVEISCRKGIDDEKIELQRTFAQTNGLAFYRTNNRQKSCMWKRKSRRERESREVWLQTSIFLVCHKRTRRARSARRRSNTYFACEYLKIPANSVFDLNYSKLQGWNQYNFSFFNFSILFL